MAYRQRDELLSHVLDEDEVEELIQHRKEGLTLVQLAKMYGVHKNTVRNILRRAEAAK